MHILCQGTAGWCPTRSSPPALSPYALQHEQRGLRVRRPQSTASHGLHVVPAFNTPYAHSQPSRWVPCVRTVASAAASAGALGGSDDEPNQQQQAAGAPDQQGAAAAPSGLGDAFLRVVLPTALALLVSGWMTKQPRCSCVGGLSAELFRSTQVQV